MRMGQQAEKKKRKDQTERVTGLARKTGDSKVESNDSPEKEGGGDQTSSASLRGVMTWTALAMHDGHMGS